MEVTIKKEELIKRAKDKLRKKGQPNPTFEEIRAEIREMVLKGEIKELKKLIEHIPQGIPLEFQFIKASIFDSLETRKILIGDLSHWAKEEKKKWIRETCSFRIEDFLKMPGFSKKLWYLISIPFDWYTINQYFNLMQNFTRNIIELCNLDLPPEKFNSSLAKLKKTAQELSSLDRIFIQYCQLDFSYYQRIKEFLEKKFLRYGDNQEVNEIVKKIKEVI